MILRTFLFLTFLLVISSCEDFFLRFKYETYECEKNSHNLKKIFILNQNVGDTVEGNIDDRIYNLKIEKNSEEEMIIESDNPKILIKINKNNNLLNVNIKNHVFSVKCENYRFRM